MRTAILILFICLTTFIYGQQDTSKNTYFDMRNNNNNKPINLKIKPVKEEAINLYNDKPTVQNNVYQNTMNGEVTIPAVRREEKNTGTVATPYYN